MAMFMVSAAAMASTIAQLPRGNSTVPQPIIFNLQFVFTETPKNFPTDNKMKEEGSHARKQRKIMPRGLSDTDLDVVCELLEGLGGW